MIIKLYDLRNFSKPVNRAMFEEQLNKIHIQRLLRVDGWYIDTMRNLFSINPKNSVAKIKKLWFENDHDIYADLEWLNTLVANKVRAELKHNRINFHIKGTYLNGIFTLIGFGYCYKPKMDFPIPKNIKDNPKIRVLVNNKKEVE